MKYLALIRILLICVCIDGCSKPTTSTKYQNTLLVDIGGEGASIDPARAENGQELRVVNDLFAGLIDFDQSNRPILGMADKYTISSDGKTYTFYLRQNLKFSDGTPITAADFVYSWQRLVNPKTGSTYNFLLANVVNAQEIIDGKLPSTALGVQAIGKYIFQVKLNHPMSEFLTYITAPAVFVVPKHVIDKYQESWTNPKNIVTSGAYILKEHVINGHMLAIKNMNYYNESMVHIQQVKYFPFFNSNVGIASYETGGLDTTWQNVPVDKFNSLKQKYQHELHVFTWERTNFIEFNMRNPKYKNNPKLRQALSMAIDRQVLAYKVLRSGQIPLYSVVTPTIENGKYKNSGYSWQTLSTDKRNKLAQELYQQAGFNSNKPLKVTISFFNNDINKKTAIAIAAMWKQVLGVEVELVNQELKAWQVSGSNGDFDLRMSTWGADYNFVTTYTPSYLCNNGNNHSGYCNPEYDKLIKQASIETNLEHQKQIYLTAINIVNNDYPVIPFIEPAHQRLVKPRVKGYKIEDNYLDNVQSKWFFLQ